MLFLQDVTMLKFQEKKSQKNKSLTFKFANYISSAVLGFFMNI